VTLRVELHCCRLKFRARADPYQDYFTMCAIRDQHWPLLSLPWHFSSHWAEVLHLGRAVGTRFWEGLLLSIPNRDPHMAIRTAVDGLRDVLGVTGSDRPTSLAALGGLLNVVDLQRPTIEWSQTRLGDVCLGAMCNSLDEGALPHVTKLHLQGNQIGEAGMRTFADALRRGVLRRVQVLRLSGNQIGDDGLRALSEALGAGALSDLTELYLNANGLSDTGMPPLAEAIKPKPRERDPCRASGALSKCRVLTLASNRIERAGAAALAEVCRHGALSALERFLLVDNPGTATPVTEALREYKQKVVLQAQNKAAVGASSQKRLEREQSKRGLKKQGGAEQQEGHGHSQRCVVSGVPSAVTAVIPSAVAAKAAR
jgi:hypothetical protein